MAVTTDIDTTQTYYEQNSLRWYVLNHIGGDFQHIAQKAVDKCNSIIGSSLQLFAPTYVCRDDSDGSLRLRTVSLTFHYVFVRGSFSQIKALCAQPNRFSLLLDHAGTERYATVDDRTMAGFQNIARAYNNCLPFFPLTDIDLEEGDLVEVIRGDFPGLIGHYIPHPKSSSGNILLRIYNKVGTVAFNVRATDVRVLRFASGSRRANDQIDAFTPHLLAALRYHYAGMPLPDSLLARLTFFISRMKAVSMTSRKLEATLRLQLYAATTILGSDLSLAVSTLARYRQLAPDVTNSWTIALHHLILTILDRAGGASEDPSYSFPADLQLPLKPGDTLLSRAQRAIVDEYAYYFPEFLHS